MLHHLPLVLPMFGIIRLVTGPLGTGKSYFGVRAATGALKAGSIVVTNFDLVPNWTDQVARRGRFRKNSRKVKELEALYRTRYKRIHTMAELAELRVRPEPPFAHELEPGKWQVHEGSMVVILDEAHRWLNARLWSKEGRGELIESFALARKRGMIVYLLAQRGENLDVQVRELFEDHIHLKNLRRSLRILGVRVCPFNVFIAGWYNHAYEDECVRTDRFFLGWDKRLYDTMDTVSFHDGESSQNVVYLPTRPDAECDQPRAAGSPAAPAAAAPAESADGDVLAPPEPVPVGDPGFVPTVPDPSLGA